MKLESLILRRADKKLQPYRLRADNFKQEHLEYKNYIASIQECIQKATYWHGTGRYHYEYQGESRYESVSTNCLVDVLDSIISQNGLIPHQDPWIPSGGKTVSLGTVRMHSRLFARIHLYENDSLAYELGSAQYWIQLYVVLILFWTCTNVMSGLQFIKSFFRLSAFRDMQTWGSAIRKPKNGRVISVWDVISGNCAGSDIIMNYPLLIGIDKDSLEVIDTIPLTYAVEVRTLQEIALKNFSHIEVPLAKVKETELFLKSRGVSVKVLPMEFVDAYMSNLPLRTLAYS